MAKLDSKQLNPKFTGSFTLSGSFVGDSTSTSSFARVIGSQGVFSDVNVTDDLSVTDDVAIGGVLTATGGTVLGNASTDTHNILGHITASGNISASGIIFASKFESAGQSNEVISFNDNLNITGNITSSGDVSGSNTSTGSFGNLRVSGLSVPDMRTLSSSIQSRLTTDSASLSSRITATETGGIFGVTAGTGLSGGGTSGTVTVDVDFSDATLASNISGSFTSTSSSLSTRITNATASIQGLKTDSGSFSTRITNATSSIAGLKTDSGSFSTRLTTEEANVDTLQSRVGQSLNVSDAPTFGGLTIQGKLTAQEYVVSSSVTTMSIQQASGSTIFGDTLDDTHDFTGSLDVTGSVTASFFKGDGSGLINVFSGTTPSSSISSRITSLEAEQGGIFATTGSIQSTTNDLQVTGSLKLTGDGTFNNIVVGGGTFTSASLAAGGGGGNTDYNGNRRILQTGFPTLFSASFNAGTSGSIQNFLDAVFFPNTAPAISSSRFTIDEFISSGSEVGTITATDAEAISSDISFATQSGYTDNFFKIHSGSGLITTNTSTSASFNTVNRGDGQFAHPFLVQVTDTIAVSTATIFIRITPNTAPNFRTTSTAGSIINNQTGSVNENTTDGTQILEFFLTDSEGDTTTISPLSQSAANRFSLATANVSGGKRLRITTNTSSFDFETITKHHLAVSASDEHFGNTSGSYLTTLPILVNVTDNNAPTMASQVFSLNESSGSNDNHGLGANTNSLTTVGTITTNDTEGDTVTFTGLSLIAGSGGGNTSQNDPSNNPFQVTSAGVLQLKAGQFLNSDIFNQYRYNATYRDNFNAASSSGVITVNITDDPIPHLTNNAGDQFSGDDLFYIIESATSGNAIRVSSNGRTGTQADFNSNETVFFTVSGSPHLSINTSNGNLSVGENISGSIYNFDSTSYITGSVTASNAFGTMTSSKIQVKVQINNAPTPSFSNSTAAGFLNSNEARANTNNLSTITFSDTESDSLNHNTFVFTDPSGQLTTVKSGDTYFVRANSNLSGSTTYQMTASIQDTHGFRTGTTKNTFTIVQADNGTLGGNTTSHILESALSGSTTRTNSNGFGGSAADLSVSYTNGSNFGGQSVQTFTVFQSDKTTPHPFLTSSAEGGITIKSNISESVHTNGAQLTASVVFQDQYQNIGSGSIVVNIAGNSAPTASFTNNTTFLNSNEARPGNKLVTISFTDPESDSLDHNSFVFTDPSGQLQTTKVGDTYEVFARNNLSGSVSSSASGLYTISASIKDTTGFATGVRGHQFTIATADLGTLGGNTSSHIIESAVSGANLVTNSNGRTGGQADLSVSYANAGFGSPSVQNFNVFEADKTTSHQFITSTATGGLSLKANLSGSGFKFGSPALTASVIFEDQYQNFGSGSISVTIAKNNPPSITLNPSSVTLSAEKAISGSFITSASFSDTESDTINFESFAFGGTHGSLFSAHQSGNAMIVTANTDISASVYSFNVTVKDVHGFHTSDATAGSLTVTPMIYFYKNTNVLVLDGTEATAITQLGDAGGDDAGITSGSFMGQLKAGQIGNTTITEAGGQQMILVASQSVNHLANNGGTSTFRQFGNIALNGNSDNGHQFVVLYPSSSQVFQKPSSLRAGLGGSTAGEFTVFNDNSSSDQAVTAGLHYFSTDSGVKVFGNDRWGMIFALDASTNPTQFYHLLSSSGSAPSSEV